MGEEEGGSFFVCIISNISERARLYINLILFPFLCLQLRYATRAKHKVFYCAYLCLQFAILVTLVRSDDHGPVLVK